MKKNKHDISYMSIYPYIYLLQMNMTLWKEYVQHEDKSLYSSPIYTLQIKQYL